MGERERECVSERETDIRTGEGGVGQFENCQGCRICRVCSCSCQFCDGHFETESKFEKCGFFLLTNTTTITQGTEFSAIADKV